jgi:hypothetical protein
MTDTQGLFTVTQIDPIAVEFSLPQQMLPTLQGLIGAGAPGEGLHRCRHRRRNRQPAR